MSATIRCLHNPRSAQQLADRCAGPGRKPLPQPIAKLCARPRSLTARFFLTIIDIQNSRTRRRNSLCAFSNITSNTDESPGDELITSRTSAVAVSVERLARLGDQPRILHRDHRLRTEILEQRDLLVSKRAHLLTINRDHAEQAVSLRSATPT